MYVNAKCPNCGCMFGTNDAKLEFERLYINATKLCPTLLESHYNLGVYYFDNKDFDNAIKCFNDALKIKNYETVFIALGKAYFEKGDNNE